MTVYDGRKLIQAVIINEQAISKLYRELAQESDGTAKRLFEKLSADEDRHESMYKAILDNVPNDGIVKLNEEDKDFLEILIRNHKLTHENMKKAKNKEEALLMAEKIERESMILVSELMNLYSEFEEKNLKLILNEEKKHLQYVLDAKFNANLHLLGL